MSLAANLTMLRGLTAQIADLHGNKAELSLYGPFNTFLQDVAGVLGHPVFVVQQVGTLNLVPDYGLFRNDNVVGWVELKAPNKHLNTLTGHDRRQFERCLQNLQAFVLTNGWDWRYYVEGQLAATASLPTDVLGNPSRPVSADSLADLEDVLDRCMGRSPLPVGTVEEAVEQMARRARAVRRSVELEMGSPSPLVQGLYEEFRELVYASGRPYTADNFADAYAQTSVFGLLLALVNSGAPVTMQSAAKAIGSTLHPFLARCLQLFTDQTLPADMAGVLQEAITSINRIPPTLFTGIGSYEPILYAYEKFFAAYDGEERAARGVYYTPSFVVSHQVSGIQQLLRDAFGLRGLTDQGVNFLDPATGTGTYLLGLLNESEAELTASGAAADVELSALVGDRLHAFELMVAPYSVAHQRVGAFLLAHGVSLTQRLPIYLVDSLAEVLTGQAQSRFGALGAEIAQERSEAERIKRDEPVLVIYGNPPYDRIKRAQLGDKWLLDLLDDLKDRTPAGDRVNLKALYDFYVAFWRWAIWLVAERSLPSGTPQGRAIIAYITNRSWLFGRGFGGLRSLVSDVARQVWVLDLGGDRRTSHTRVRDQNVFDIGVGVAITFVVVDSKAASEPEVFYRRIWGSRAEKELELGFAFDPSTYESVSRTSKTDPFIPVDWGVLSTSPSVEEVFLQRETGVQTSRPWLIGIQRSDVLDTSGPSATGSVGEWSQLGGQEREDKFHVTRTHPKAPQEPVSTSKLARYAYRPFDYRVLYNDPAYVEWPRPKLRAAFGAANLALVTIERGFGAGPAGFPVDALPDLHVFRGFGGARGVYPLYEAAGQAQQTLGGGRQPNLHADVIVWASAVLATWIPEDLFAYITAILNAPSYTARFEGGLATERPRIPLTTDQQLAVEAIRLGHHVMDAWTLAPPARADVRWDASGATASQIGEASWATGDRLAVAGRYLEGVPIDVWEYEVSGYPVLPRYCRARSQRPASADEMASLRRVVTCVRTVVESGTVLDDLLDRVLKSPLRIW